MAKKRPLKASEYPLHKKELKTLVNAAASFRDRCILKTLAQTGLRRFELVNLDVRDLDVEHGLPASP